MQMMCFELIGKMGEVYMHTDVALCKEINVFTNIYDNLHTANFHYIYVYIHVDV